MTDKLRLFRPAGVYNAFMHTHEAFMQAIIERPADDQPRLIYADRLEEEGDPRGEFIRLQCELARLSKERYPKPEPNETDQDRYRYYAWANKRDSRMNVLRRRERELLLLIGQPWPMPAAALKEQWGYLSDGNADNLSRLSWEFRRGFVSVVRCTTDVFLRHAAELFRQQPIERVTLLGKEPMWDIRGFWCWRDRWPLDADEPDNLPEGLYVQGGYKTAALAKDAASCQCVRFGRQSAGLVAITE